MRGRMITGAMVAATVCAMASRADGQEGMRPLRVGEPVSGTLTAQDPRFSSRGPFQAYRLEAKVGTRYVITLSSTAFDAYAWVARSVGGLTEELAADDDGAGGTDARLRFRAPAAGSYVIVAQSLEASALGAYVLRVDEVPPSAPAVAVALTLGQAREGMLDERSPVLAGP